MAGVRPEPSVSYLLGRLAEWPAVQRYWVAFSGGLDSTVLLDLLAAEQHALGPDRLIAVHIHHGLLPQADEWVAHCRQQAEARGVPIIVSKLGLVRQTGVSTEELARQSRYAMFASLLEPGDMLLTAHHQDDQAETLLLQALRGAGPAGLAAMPALAPLGQGWLGRPLLDLSREQLREYAQRHQLQWVDDASNVDPAVDRSYLRSEIMPRLREHWPSAAATLARSARWCAQADAQIEQLLADELTRRWGASGQLDLHGLDAMAQETVAHLLRLWLRRWGARMLSHQRLQTLMKALLTGRQDTAPCLRWEGWEVRRYRGQAYLMRALPTWAVDTELVWSDVSQPLALPAEMGQLQLTPQVGEGLWPDRLQGRLTVRFRGGGERIRLPNQPHSRTVKNLFQEAGVPPWHRSRLPLLYVDGVLAAIAYPGDVSKVCWLAADFASSPTQQSWRLDWCDAPQFH